MILFTEKFKVLNKELKSVPRKDGNGTFDFTEVRLEDLDSKRTTTVVARLADKDMEVVVGKTYDMTICLNSAIGKDGRVWNNFTVTAFKPEDFPSADTNDYVPLEDDEIPF